MFIIGGLSGVMLASVPVNWQVHQTYFVVAHIHYVLVGGSVFGFFAAFYYWLPKMTGFKLNDALGKWNFWVLLLGFNLAFFPQHIAGMQGMPRRIYTYAANQGWEIWNLMSTIGAYTIALAVLIFIINFFYSASKREAAGENPWDGATLEWSTTSPPPDYNFAEAPTVSGMNPLWEKKNGGNGYGH
jgi:heme/copper-type cytochrome/quinol oxidase subunit 1